MRLSQLRHYIAVVQTGSLRAAARAVGLSQPAISKSVRQLEAELHVQLLQRNTRGAAVTPAGKAFLARARVIQSELRRAEEDLASFRGGAQGSVAFGIAPAPCMLIVPEAMLQFRRRHPQASVRIVEGVNTATVPLVRDETLDFCVGQRPNDDLDPAITFKPLFRTELVVFGRRSHPLRHARSLRELAGASWLVFHPFGSGAVLEEALGAAGLPIPQPALQCESYATALSLLAKTDILGLLIPQMTAEPFAQRYLERIPLNERLPAALIGMYSRTGVPLAPAAAAMAQAVSMVARRLSARTP